MDIASFAHNACDKDNIVLLVKEHFDQHIAMYCLISTFEDVTVSASCDEASILYTIKASDFQKNEIIRTLNRSNIIIDNHKYITEVDIEKNTLKIVLRMESE